jgi:hypothetical protein
MVEWGYERGRRKPAEDSMCDLTKVPPMVQDAVALKIIACCVYKIYTDP